MTLLVDIDKVKELIQLMVDNDLLSISVRDGSEEITLRRPGRDDPPVAALVAQPVVPAHALPAALSPSATQEAAPAAGEEVDEDSGLVPIESPMVGTWYMCPHPGAPPFVKVGSEVAADTVVCIIEAMKVFNEIPSEVSGTIERILVTNENPVEFGQPLFMVRPH